MSSVQMYYVFNGSSLTEREAKGANSSGSAIRQEETEVEGGFSNFSANVQGGQGIGFSSCGEALPVMADEWDLLVSSDPVSESGGGASDPEQKDEAESDWECLSLTDESFSSELATESCVVISNPEQKDEAESDWECLSLTDESLPNVDKDAHGIDSMVDKYGVVSSMEELIKAISIKFTSCDIREHKNRETVFSLPALRGDAEINEEPTQQEVVEVILGVASNVVFEVNDDCDFLLKASDLVKKYFVSSLGISSRELTLILLTRELGALVSSEEDIKSMRSHMVISLLRDVAANCFYFRDSRYYDYLPSRASLDLWCAGLFLRKLTALLVFFPEALHPRFVSYGFSEHFFDEFFTPEGRCSVK